MSKAEKFIQDFTKNCSNAQGGWVNGEYNTVFRPWLTPDQARKAVEIERQEVIEKAIAWFRQVKEQRCSFDGIDAFIVHFKEAMKDE